MALFQFQTEVELSSNLEIKEKSALRRPCKECGTLVGHGYARCEKCRRKARNEMGRDVMPTQCRDCSALDSTSHENKRCIRYPNCQGNRQKEKISGDQLPRCKDCDQAFRGPKGCVRCLDCRARRQGGRKQTQPNIGTTANETTNNTPTQSNCQTCNELVPCTCVLTKCAEPKCRERFLVPWSEEYGARCAKCRKQKDEETRHLEDWKRLKHESAAEVEFQSLEQLLRFLGSLEERRVRFSGCYWLVADPQLLGHDRAMAVARYMTQIGAVHFDPHPITSRCRDGELLFSCLCTPLQTGKGSFCGGFINILVSEDDTTHPLGIDGQRVTIRILHPTSR